MHIARPLAALSAITLAVATLGSATASGASASPSSDRNDRAVAGAPASPGDRSDLVRRLTGDRTGPRQAKVRLVATTKGPVTARAVRASARALGFTIGVGELDRLGMVSVETTPRRAEAVQLDRASSLFQAAEARLAAGNVAGAVARWLQAFRLAAPLA